EGQELADVAEQLQATLVVDGDRVDRADGNNDPRLDGPACLPGRGRAGAGRRGARAPARGQDAADQRHRQAHSAAPADEVAARQPPGDELVDDVLLDGPAPPPETIKPFVVDVTAGVHRTLQKNSPAPQSWRPVGKSNELLTLPRHKLHQMFTGIQ